MEGPTGSSLLRLDGDQNVVIASGMNPDEAARALHRLNRGPGLKVGDLLEWTAAGAFVAAGYIQYRSLPLALTVGGVAFAYFAQCLASREIPRPRLPRVHVVKHVRRVHLVRLAKRVHLVRFVKATWKRKFDNDSFPRPS